MMALDISDTPDIVTRKVSTMKAVKERWIFSTNEVIAYTSIAALFGSIAGLVYGIVYF